LNRTTKKPPAKAKVSKPAPKKRAAKKLDAKKPDAKRHDAKKSDAKKPDAKKSDVRKPASKKATDADPTLDFAMRAVEAALDKKGLAPTLLDLSNEGSYADYILVVSGRSDRHVQSVADGVKKTIRDELGRMPIGIEGNGDGQWSLIDYGEIVVHVFFHPIREHYDLEGLWSEAPRVELDVPADSQLNYSDVYA
jgi:ribosome-associated protein